FLRRQRAIAEAEEKTPEGPQKEGREFVAPILVGGQRLGTIRMASNGTTLGLDDARLSALAQKYGFDTKKTRSLLSQVMRSRNTRPASIQFLFILANAIARLCYQEFQL